MRRYCRSTSIRLAALIARSTPHNESEVPTLPITDRDKVIIKMVCEERTNEDIGQALFIGPRTVERIRASIMDKIGAKKPAGVVIHALRNNLYFLE